MHFAALLLTLCALTVPTAPARAQAANDPIYVFHTNLGNIRVQLFPDIAPATVTNFLNYVNRGDYNGSFLHRSVSGFIVQGGGYTFVNGQAQAITTDPPVANEFHLSNMRGTLAMAKLGNDPNSATSQWFFNESDNNAANLDNQNGGFTVFGRIVDSAGLAVMDRIAAVPTVNAGSPFDQLPVINYQSGTITQDNLVQVTSIGASPNWGATSVSVGGDNYQRALWDNADGTAALWLMNSNGQFLSQQNYGPYAGWTCQAISTGSDNNTRVLWTKADGSAALWRLDSQNNFVTQQNYGPYAGWTLTTISAAPDGTLRALWANADGTAALWRLDSQNRFLDQQNYGPYSGWSPRSLRVGPDGTERMLWTNTSGAAAFWRLNAQNGFLDQQNYGPFSGFTVRDLVGGPGGVAHAVWSNAAGQTALWTLNGADQFLGQQNYGPYSGWAVQSLAVGPDGGCHLLWDNIGGASAFWRTDAGGAFLDQQNYGPF